MRLLKSKSGFTLVELLVVIVIIAILASVTFALGPKMLRRADAAKSVQNIGQIGKVMISHAADNSFRLPPLRGMVQDQSGTEVEQIWHEVLLAEIFPGTTVTSFKEEIWWENQKPFFRNPLLKKNAAPRGWTPTNPGFAMNRRIFDNLDRDISERIPLATISDQSRTPIVAPFYDVEYTYMGAEISGPAMEALLIDDQAPILFVDGHVEVMSLRDYTQRELFNIPKPRTR